MVGRGKAIDRDPSGRRTVTAAPADVGEAGPALVTVVIPTLNRPQTAREAIRSALDQVGVQARLLISDNCSEARFDAAYAELFASLPAQARVLRQPERLAVEDHFPRLLALVDTRYVVLLADDDTLAPWFLARAIALAAERQAGSVFGPYRADRQRTGRSQTHDFDYTHRSTMLRAVHFLCRRNDAFIYGLFRTELLREAMKEFRPLRVLGRQTLIRIAYTPLFACLLAAPYAHVAGEPVWINAADSVKSQAYLGDNKVRKLVELVLGEWVLAARFLRVARSRGGLGFAFALAPVIAAMAAFHCLAFSLMALRRLFAAVTARSQRT